MGQGRARVGSHVVPLARPRYPLWVFDQLPACINVRWRGSRGGVRGRCARLWRGGAVLWSVLRHRAVASRGLRCSCAKLLGKQRRACARPWGGAGCAWRASRRLGAGGCVGIALGGDRWRIGVARGGSVAIYQLPARAVWCVRVAQRCCAWCGVRGEVLNLCGRAAVSACAVRQVRLRGVVV